MFELLNETLFEKHIAEYLAGSKMYNQRTPKDFNIQKLVDSDMLLQFLREEVTKRVYFIGNERMLIAHDSNRLRFS